ncbi:carbon-nitrogen hydrolase family protein [Simiduia curdlanivorans]|uniref:Carbon-nitrogen hydrolase family protein n=1 Tax=Simiduia curdlanivorans TaxID=1492769 RepID=A0ABV8V740_9GAMM|nr:carbon-nitrogen hydrolase family protein [Simiduia curdlanivorans]MDN3640604.1 carbon-nitrogen hydrolase family protein [Simiduia curdlanivorans]
MSFSIAAAQIPAIKGKLSVNARAHMQVVAQAHAEGVNCLVFPELSLTGYEPTLAASMALSVNDPCFVLLAQQAKRYQMTIIVGGPVETGAKPAIGAFIIQPSGQIKIYRKLFLHEGEAAFFQPGHEHYLLALDGHRLLNAICADTTHPEHAAACRTYEASIYAAGVLITEAGYGPDTEQLQGYAKAHNVLVVMANHCADTGGFAPAGKSAIWDSRGLVSGAESLESCLVIATQHDDQWHGRCVALCTDKIPVV